METTNEKTKIDKIIQSIKKSPITKMLTRFPSVGGYDIELLELYLWKLLIYRSLKTYDGTYTIANLDD